MRALIVLVHHEALVVARVFVGGEVGCGVLEGELAGLDVGVDRIQARGSLLEFSVRDLGAEQDVAAIDSVATLLDQLDDVVAILRLHNVRNALGVG